MKNVKPFESFEINEGKKEEKEGSQLIWEFIAELEPEDIFALVYYNKEAILKNSKNYSFNVAHVIDTIDDYKEITPKIFKKNYL